MTHTFGKVLIGAAILAAAAGGAVLAVASTGSAAAAGAAAAISTSGAANAASSSGPALTAAAPAAGTPTATANCPNMGGHGGGPGVRPTPMVSPTSGS